MNARRNLRIATLGAIAAAAVIHAGTRLEWKSAAGVEPVAFDARPLSLGDSIGNAVIDGVVNKPLTGVRLRLAQCGNPAFVFPLSILSVSEQQVVDRAYGLPAYRSTDVYRGHVRDGFSHISRITSYVASSSGSSLVDGANHQRRPLRKSLCPLGLRRRQGRLCRMGRGRPETRAQRRRGRRGVEDSSRATVTGAQIVRSLRRYRSEVADSVAANRAAPHGRARA